MKVPPSAVLTMHGREYEDVETCSICGSSITARSQWCTGWPSPGMALRWLVTVSCPGCGHDGQYLTDAAGVRRGDDDA